MHIIKEMVSNWLHGDCKERQTKHERFIADMTNKCVNLERSCNATSRKLVNANGDLVKLEADNQELRNKKYALKSLLNESREECQVLRNRKNELKGLLNVEKDIVEQAETLRKRYKGKLDLIRALQVDVKMTRDLVFPCDNCIEQCDVEKKNGTSCADRRLWSLINA